MLAFQSRGHVDAVAHHIAVARLDDVAEVNADAEDDAPVLRHAGVSLDHRILHSGGAAHRVDDAAELDDAAIAGAFDDTTVMHGAGRIDQVARNRARIRSSSAPAGRL